MQVALRARKGEAACAPMGAMMAVNEIYQFAEGASGTFGEATIGKWKNYENILREYKRIFILYWLFGDYSYLFQTERGKKLLANLERVLRRHLPGWYDTHAKYSEII